MNDIDELNEYGYTKLTTHVINGDYENVKALIEQGANLDIQFTESFNLTIDYHDSTSASVNAIKPCAKPSGMYSM